MRDQEHQAHIIRRIDALLDRLDMTAPSGQPQLLTIPEAAARLGVSEGTVRRLCDRREIPYVQAGINAAKRIAITDLQAWIDRHTVRGTPNE